MIDVLTKQLNDIFKRRVEIKDQFCKAWMAVNIPDGTSPDWIINNVQLVETWSDYRLKVSWHLELKPRQEGGE